MGPISPANNVHSSRKNHHPSRQSDGRRTVTRGVRDKRAAMEQILAGATSDWNELIAQTKRRKSDNGVGGGNVGGDAGGSVGGGSGGVGDGGGGLGGGSNVGGGHV